MGLGTSPGVTLEIHHYKPQISSQSSRTYFKMRRNHQTSSFKPFQLPTQRHTYAPSPSKSSRTGIIDQRLIQGSQQPHYSSSSPRKPFNGLASSTHDEDPQLDAFASEDREEAIPDSGFGIPTSTPLRASRQPDLHPPQFARFFQRKLLVYECWWVCLVGAGLTSNSQLNYRFIGPFTRASIEPVGFVPSEEGRDTDGTAQPRDESWPIL
ncbi:unnamed protein product [Penicillium egyptiacum]|uniref:Uncharacterized protein n=1 Tax=Penicillium egyptiacum TaxID=1303716 RepID=A0A9W4KF68_9EURO|nr:unnamed protein product [Penicillium egyptiacum]